MTTKLLYSRDVAQLITSMQPHDPWDEQRARRWLRRPHPALVKQPVEPGKEPVCEPPGFKLNGAWVITLERLQQAFRPAYEEAADRAAERELEAERDDDCPGCDVLRARLREIEQQLADALTRR